MKIFDKRPLSLILCIMLGSFVFFAFYDTPRPRIILISVILLCFAISFVKPLRKFVNHVFIKVASICAIVSVILSFIYFDLWFYAYDRYKGEVNIEATVIDIAEYDYTTALYLKTDSVNETVFSSYKLIAYIDNGACDNLSVGATVEIKGIIDSFTSDSNFDAQGYYSSRGISGIINDVTSISVTGYSGYPLSRRFSDYRKAICNRIIENSNEDAGGLLCALLLGEKDMLPTGTKLDFMRIGISHILALSGMHLAILAIGFSKLLSFLKISKKPATLFTIIFTVGYMALTGFSVSVTRAGIMLIVSSTLFLLSRSKDSMTSLFIAVALICILEPYSIFDIALWLSAFATLGIVVMSEYQSEKYSKPSFLRWIWTSILSSFFAISATFAITTVKFDGTSIIAPITTLIFSVLVELFIYLGFPLILLGSLIPIKCIFIPLANLIINLAEWFSGIEWIYVSTNFILIEILSVIFAIIFFGVFIVEIKHKTLAFSSLAAILIMIFSLSAFMTYRVRNENDITYHTGNTDKIVIKMDGEICAVDIGAYRKGSAYSMYAEMAGTNLTKIDKYVITHYSYDLNEAISVLYDSILINKIYLPLPQNDTEERIFLSISRALSKRKTDIILYEPEHIIKVGDACIIPLHNYLIGTQKKNMLTILYKDNFYTYLGVDMLTGETKNMALEVIGGSHTIIFGRHESKSTEYKFTYKISTAERIVIATDRISMHSDTLSYYGEKNIIIPRKRISLIR